MLTLIENGDVYSPEPLGQVSLLLAGEKILHVGKLKRKAVEALGVDFDVIDASGCIVTPGFIDPHEHLLGGSGEKGFSSQTPEIFLEEIINSGITTVVGCLGVDTTMKTMAGLLARAKGLAEQGLSAFLWTGGYNVPPTTILSSVRDDILFVSEIIGAGEIAIADDRSTDPEAHELARLVSDAYVGGMLSNKAGITHFHVGEREERLSLLRTLIVEYHVKPECLYPTHIARNEELLREAVSLAEQGCPVDIDTTDRQLPRWLSFYREEGGDLSRLTVSSDASITSPRNLYEQICACVRDEGWELTVVLPLVTANPARILKLPTKGNLANGKDADVLVLEEGNLTLREVISCGRRLVQDGRLTLQDRATQESDRRIGIPSADVQGITESLK